MKKNYRWRTLYFPGYSLKFTKNHTTFFKKFEVFWLKKNLCCFYRHFSLSVRYNFLIIYLSDQIKFATSCKYLYITNNNCSTITSYTTTQYKTLLSFITLISYHMEEKCSSARVYCVLLSNCYTKKMCFKKHGLSTVNGGCGHYTDNE